MLNVSRQFFRNIFSSWSAYLMRITITFFFVPYITSVLGDARYGVWVIIFQTIFYFSIMDFGLTSALTRYISKFLAHHDFNNINKVLNTANLLYFITGILVLAGVFVFVTMFFNYFKISDPELLYEGKIALMILGAYMAFNFIATPFGNSLGAFHRYDIVNILNISEEIVRTGLMIFMLTQGHGLVALALVILLMTVVKHLIAAGILLRLQPDVRIASADVEKPTARMLFKYSRVSLGISLCWLILYNTDSVLLGFMSSSVAAAVYYPGAQLMHHLRNIVNTVAVPLVPAISHIESTSDISVIRSVYLRAIKYVSFFSFSVAAGVVIYAHDFVKLWLIPEFAQTADIMRILAIGTAVLLPQIIGDAILFAVEKHKKLLTVLVCESVFKLVLAVFLVKEYGMLGMAFAVVIPQVLLFTTLYPYIMSRVVETSYWRITTTVITAGLAGLAITAPTAFLLHWVWTPATWPIFFGNIIGVLIACLVIGFFLVEPEDRQRIKELIKR
ncbi:MAG: oligosaccharide flippase family protein [candidate division Zixibacteria bacterium]|nr:oligosaccharide flippase family protein [candidate division Zixibacteria bacterium]